MNTILLATIAFWFGAGLGAVIAYNAAKHPGKLEQQLSGWWAKLRRREPPAS